MDEMVNLILNSSVSIVVIVFFMYRDLKFNNALQQTLTTLVDTVDALKDVVNKNKDVVNKNKDKEDN